MAGYRGKRSAILHMLIDQDQPPNSRGLAEATGLYINTAWSVLAGQRVSAETMRRVAEGLHAPLDALFEPNVSRPPAPLRAIRRARATEQ